MARARLMATTGDPERDKQCIVELHDRRPVGVSAPAAMHVRRLKSAFELIAADLAQVRWHAAAATPPQSIIGESQSEVSCSASGT